MVIEEWMSSVKKKKNQEYRTQKSSLFFGRYER